MASGKLYNLTSPRSSRISSMTAVRLWRHSSIVRPCPLAPGISGQKARNHSSSCSMIAVNSLCMHPRITRSVRSSVNFFAMADLGDDDESGPNIDRIDNPVTALPEPILVLLIRQFFRSNRARVCRQRVDSSHKSLAILLRANGLEFLRRRRFDLKLISFHGASEISRHPQSRGLVRLLALERLSSLRYLRQALSELLR